MIISSTRLIYAIIKVKIDKHYLKIIALIYISNSYECSTYILPYLINYFIIILEIH